MKLSRENCLIEESRIIFSNGKMKFIKFIVNVMFFVRGFSLGLFKICFLC